MSFLLFVLAVQVFSHSWLECTDYRGDLEVYEKDQCLGLPRPLAGNRNVGTVFGQDIGMDFRPQGNRCQGDVTTGTPNMVTYETGKTYTLAWPPKNHAAAECTNANIPDNFLKLYMAKYDGATDPDQDTFRQNQVPASFSDDPHVNGNIDFKGFQNCPRFCENTDKSLCTGTFEIPDGVPDGTYTFQWYWAFNSPTDLYATCWEANVVAGQVVGTDTGNDQPINAITPTPQPDCTECCEEGEVQAPGTGALVAYDSILEDEQVWLECPEGFTGDFKLMCKLDEVRLIDGYCIPATTQRQGGVIAGLSLALAFVTIAFCLYVAFDRHWISSQTFVCDEETGAKGAQAKAVQNQSSVNTGRKQSVYTVSNTELPILPEAPEWYYVDLNGESQGPVSIPQLKQWCEQVGMDVAKDTYVYSSISSKDWVALKDEKKLCSQLIGTDFPQE